MRFTHSFHQQQSSTSGAAEDEEREEDGEEEEGGEEGTEGYGGNIISLDGVEGFDILGQEDLDSNEGED